MAQIWSTITHLDTKEIEHQYIDSRHTETEKRDEKVDRDYAD